MNILAIGNSFSEDATYYLHSILSAAGVDNYVVNMYIGGCPLERHWQNIESGEKAYQFQENGVKTETYVSIPDMVHEKKWDYILTQQSSHDSGWGDTYEPFLGLLIEYLHREAPQAEVLLQKTWAYEPDSTHANFMRYHRNQQEMYEKLSKCYALAADRYQLRLIPCADVIQSIRSHREFAPSQGGISICRDGFHMHYLYGRYALAYTWARMLLGHSLQDNSFVPQTDYLPGQKADQALLKLIRDCAESVF